MRKLWKGVVVCIEEMIGGSNVNQALLTITQTQYFLLQVGHNILYTQLLESHPQCTTTSL